MEEFDLSLEASIRARLAGYESMTPEERRQAWEERKKIWEDEKKRNDILETARRNRRELEIQIARDKLKNRVPGDLGIEDTKAAIKVRLRAIAAEFEQPELDLGLEPKKEPEPVNLVFNTEGSMSWDNAEKVDFQVRVNVRFSKARDWIFYDLKNKYGWDVRGESGNTFLTYRFGDNETIRGYSPADVKAKLQALSGAKYMPYVRDFYLMNPMSRFSSLDVLSYIKHMPGHKNTKGESAPYVIKSHESDKILGSYKSKSEAEKALKRMKHYAGMKPMISPEDLADKHKVSVKDIIKRLEKGKKVELEHTKDAKTAEQIASHHIDEFLNYYEELDIMEKKLKKSERK